jgi:hypothetical protein
MNEAVFYNLDYCSFYFYLISHNIVASVTDLKAGGKMSNSYLRLTNAFYTGPLAFKYCYNMYNSYRDIVNAINMMLFKSYKGSLGFYS